MAWSAISRSTQLAIVVAVTLGQLCALAMAAAIAPPGENDEIAVATVSVLEEIAPRFPRPTDAPQNLTVALGERAVFECEAFGAPPPTLRWLKDGRPTMRSRNDGNIVEEAMNDGVTTIQQASTRSKFVVAAVKLADAGRYTCVAENKNGQIKAHAYLEIGRAHVKQATDVETAWKKSIIPSAATSTSQGVPASIYMWTSYRVEREGPTAQLFCRARGSPQPVITWMAETEDGTEPMPLDKRNFEVLPNGDLLIRDTTVCIVEGCGFLCTASNRFGSDTVDSYIYATNDPVGSEIKGGQAAL